MGQVWAQHLQLDVFFMLMHSRSVDARQSVS